MAEQCLVIEDPAYFSEVYIVARAAVVSDQVRALDALVGIVRGQAIGDTLTVGEAYDGTRTQWLRDTLTTGEQYLLLAQQDEVLSDWARVADRFSITRSAAWADPLTAGEDYSITTSATLGDGVLAADAAIPVRHPMVMLSESLRVTGHLIQERTGLVVEVPLTVVEGWHLGRTLALVDPLGVNEAYALVGHPSATLGDSVQVQDRLLHVHRDVLADSATVADAWSVALGFTIGDTAATGDLFTPFGHPVAMLADSAWVAESFIQRNIGRTVLADGATVGEVYSAHLAPRAVVGDELFVDERYVLPAALPTNAEHTAGRVGRATAWTANTDTWGCSRYTNFEFNSLAVVDGVLMGANDTGLWRLDAQDDAGEPILAHIQTDLQDYGAEQVKSAPLVYAGAATDGALQLTVDAVIQGASSFYTYTFEPRHAGDFAPTRCKVGRGVRARYLQFTVGNQSGAAFTIDQLSVLAEAGSRRV